MKSSALALLILILWIGYPVETSAQSFPFEIELKPKTIPNLPGLHSYAYAQKDGRWLILGGRLDGLHARQPFNAFPANMNNTDIYVVDPSTSQVWTASTSSLPAALNEQLQSTNMAFHQDADTLYFAGGYGFSVTANDHITYPSLIAIDIPGLMNAVINAQALSSHFKQIQDNIFAITGGHLEKLNGTFYLVGGHRFDGRYNPMGNATYVQSYSDQIRKFTLNNSGNQLSYANYTAITDGVHLHRRDYNLIPQIFPDGTEGFTISSGVFQVNANLPFLYPVDITETGYTPITSFNQYLSNYHSAVASLHDASSNAMHTFFFGGMSQYYYQNGSLIQDNQVPFVKTISRLTRDANNQLTEFQMPAEMPSLKGASAEFILNQNLPHTESGIIELNALVGDSFLIGHIYGGIKSSAQNPFSNNQTNLTVADNTLYEVWMKRSSLGMKEFEINGANPFEVDLYPNPAKKHVYAKFHLENTTEVRYILTNLQGKIMDEAEYEPMEPGEHEIKISLKSFSSEKLILNMIFDDKFYVTKSILSE